MTDTDIVFFIERVVLFRGNWLCTGGSHRGITVQVIVHMRDFFVGNVHLTQGVDIQTNGSKCFIEGFSAADILNFCIDDFINRMKHCDGECFVIENPLKAKGNI